MKRIEYAIVRHGDKWKVQQITQFWCNRDIKPKITRQAVNGAKFDDFQAACEFVAQKQREQQAQNPPKFRNRANVSRYTSRYTNREHLLQNR